MANASNSSANRYKGQDIDVDGDGRVGKADHASNAQNVKGNDIDGDADGRVDAADHATDADTVNGYSASELGFSLGDPSDVTANRAEDTQYTNNTDGVLMVAVDTNGGKTVGGYVDGYLQQSGGGGSDKNPIGVQFFVPAGSTYKVVDVEGYSTFNINTWLEYSL